jgi:glycosyltransferase involved in cell wall biosynthesis
MDNISENSSPKRLLILIGGHFALAPRPQKEAAAAKQAGFQVQVRGIWWDENLSKEDIELSKQIGIEFAPVIDLRRISHSTRLFRFKQRLAREVYARLGILSSRSFGLASPEMLSEALRLKPDFTMVHSEAGLWVAQQLLVSGFKVGVDFEDWFSEDLPVSQRRGRPVAAIKSLECCLLRHAHLTLSTTLAMGEALAQAGGITRIPLMIPNCFPFAQAPFPGDSSADPRMPETVSFYWFSQTIGPGRGLETLSKALPQLRGEWELHLRGSLRGYDGWFQEHFNRKLQQRITVHPAVPNQDLARHSASHDVGLALEVPHCRSRDLTATNKIFEYLRCGLAVIATSTKGQLEVMAHCPDAGWVIAPAQADDLAKIMQQCLDDRACLAKARGKAREAAAGVWAWERFERDLGNALITAADS